MTVWIAFEFSDYGNGSVVGVYASFLGALNAYHIDPFSPDIHMPGYYFRQFAHNRPGLSIKPFPVV